MKELNRNSAMPTVGKSYLKKIIVDRFLQEKTINKPNQYRQSCKLKSTYYSDSVKTRNYLLYWNIGPTVYGAQKGIQNPVKHLRCSALQK